MFRAGGALAAALPERLAYALGRLAGRVVFAARVPARAAVEANMRVVLGSAAREEAVRRTAREVFENVGRYYVDLFRLPHVSLRELNEQRILETGYSEYLEPALRAGRGVILVSAHVGSPEVPVQAIGARGHSYLALVEPIRPARLFDYVQRTRVAHGHRFVPAGPGGVKAALRALRSGGLVLLLGDRDIQGTGRCVPLFGRPARLPTGGLELAMRTGATLIPGFVRRLDDRCWSARLLPPLALQSSGDPESDLDTNLRAFATLLEEAIREAPEQWIVLSRVWGHCPEG